MNLLSVLNFDKSNITVLFDEKILGTETTLPTAYNITTQINRFVNRLNENDQAILFYSGHGMRVNDKKTHSQESCIVPMDYKKNGVINSETIRYYLNKVSENVNMLCIYDCCNSGTICNLKYHMFDTSYKKDITIKHRAFNSENWILRQNFKISDKIQTHKSTNIETDANIVSISGCFDDQVSYDLIKNGALTLNLLNTFREKGFNLSFSELLQSLRCKLICMNVRQTPQIFYGNSHTNMNIKFNEFLKI
jgi:hypothetical protein